MNVLILGVGDAQLDAIKYLKEKGDRVHGISYRSEGPGLGTVDEFCEINITDKEAVVKYCLKNEIRILYSIGSDIAMPTIGYVASKLGLPSFINQEQAELLHDKAEFRKYSLEHKLSPIPFKIASRVEEFLSWDEFPAILKPTDSQGQRGVYEVANKSEVRKFFDSSLSFSRKGKVILEKYIDGPEISVNAFMHRGILKFFFVSSREKLEGYPGGIIKGHQYPVKISVSMEDKLKQMVGYAIDVMKISDGPLYFQIKYTPDTPYIIEMTPRLDGCHIWRLIRYCTGVDLLDLSFRLLKGNELKAEDFEYRWDPQSNRLEFMHGIPESTFISANYPVKNVIFAQHYYKEGEIVRPMNKHMEKVGYVISEVDQLKKDDKK